jgi:hypothetical protein
MERAMARAGEANPQVISFALLEKVMKPAL